MAKPLAIVKPNVGRAPQSGTYSMAPMPRVLLHPHRVLAKVAREVDPRDPAIVALSHMLIATMRASPACTGIAAPQIGEAVRVFCMDITGHRKARSCAGPIVMVNPRIVFRSFDIVMREGA